MSSNIHNEIEAKFQVRGDETIAELSDATSYFDTYTVSTANNLQVTDVYFDTKEFALLRHGYSLRVRTAGDSHNDPNPTITLKTLPATRIDSLTERGEWEERIEPRGQAPYPKSWPATIRKRVTSITSTTTWHPMVQLDQNRLKRMLALPDQPTPITPIAELSLDTVAVYALSTSTDELPVARFAEIELELVAPDQLDALRHLVSRFKKETGLTSLNSSKFERALVALNSATSKATTDAPHSQADLSIAEFCRAIWRVQLMQILLLEHGVRSDSDTEYIHDMRVATRRMRVATQLFASYFSAKHIRTFATSIRKLARRLGSVRDFDVALANLDTYRQQSEESSDSQASHDLAQRWRQQRRRMYKRLIDYLDSASHAEFITEFSGFCAAPGMGVQPPSSDPSIVSPSLTRHVLPGLIWQRFAHVRAYEPILSATTQTPFETLHNLRIACKYHRYLLEFAEPILEPKLKRYTARLKQLQDLLGELNDAAVELEWLGALIREHPELQSRIDFLNNRSEELRTQVPGPYQRVIDHSARKILARIVAAL